MIFGPEDSFLNLFATLARLTPVIVLACPEARFQPVYVGDVARASLAALEDRGLVTTWAGEAARFVAVAPDVALDNLARMREQDLVRARAHAQTLADRWSRA